MAASKPSIKWPNPTFEEDAYWLPSILHTGTLPIGNPLTLNLKVANISRCTEKIGGEEAIFRGISSLSS